MLLREPESNDDPDDLTDDATFDHTDKPAGHLTSLLPRSLVELSFLACPYRYDRTRTYWLDLIKDLMTEKGRLSSLMNVEIMLQDPTSPCIQCKDNRLTCSLYNRNKISDTMKKMCTDANIELRIMRAFGNPTDAQLYLDLGDPKSYVGGEVVYNHKFDDWEL